jgi:hypothetical protein
MGNTTARENWKLNVIVAMDIVGQLVVITAELV